MLTEQLTSHAKNILESAEDLRANFNQQAFDDTGHLSKVDLEKVNSILEMLDEAKKVCDKMGGKTPSATVLLTKSRLDY